MIVFLISDYKAWGWEIEPNGYKMVYHNKESDSIIYVINKESSGPKNVQPHKIFINTDSSHNSPKWTSGRVRNGYPNVNIIEKATETIIAWVNNPKNYLNNILLDPLIIILTLEIKYRQQITAYPEWKASLDSNKCTFFEYKNNEIEYKNNEIKTTNKDNIRIIEFKVDDYTVLFVKENDYEKSQNPKGIDELLDKILRYNKWKDILPKYIAVHALNDYIKDESKFEKKVNYICNFHHNTQEPDKEFCNLLVKVLEDIKNNRQQEAKDKCEQIIKKIKELSQKLSILIHRIAHLFLPLDIDLQGIEEVKSQESRDRRQKEYLKEILEYTAERGGDTFYRQRLAELQYLVVGGEHVDFSGTKGGKTKECKPVEAQNKENLLPDSRSIYKLIIESKKKEEIIDSPDWKVLKNLCGLEEKEGVEEKNPREGDKIYEPAEAKDSPILQFMCLLDCKILKKQVKSEDVGAVLNHFSNGWDVSGANPNPIKSFHDWFCNLMECLNKIKKDNSSLRPRS